MIQIENLICDFPEGNGRTFRALALPRFSLENGACAVIGPSGAGKSTLFRCLAGLVRPAKGRVIVDGTDLTKMTEDDLSAWRAANVGCIFQEALMLPFLTVLENILLAADLAGQDRKEKKREAEVRLAQLGLDGYGTRMPARLSGGEKQRAGFVRAVLTRPRLLLADEPTASLDPENGRILMRCLLDYQRESGCLFLCATHDPAVQALFPTKFYLRKEGDRE